jgi:RNA polymerase sigma-70 factor (ECF subfamily)
MIRGSVATVDSSLVSSFLAAVPESSSEPDPRLHDALDHLLRSARLAWPTVKVEDADFLAYVAHRVRGASIVEEVEALRTADLYLACACASGDPTALQAFEDRFLRDVDAAMAHAGMSRVADEVKQQLRIKLFTTDGGASTPRIAEYSGRGDLRSWLRVVAVRAALNTLRSERRSVIDADDQRLLEVPVPGHDPELELLKARYRADFRQAVQDALSTLPARDRTLLRQYYLDGSTLRELATIYGVHVATAGRWVEQARCALFAGTKDLLMTRLGVDSQDVASMVRLIHSQLEVSVVELLRGG